MKPAPETEPAARQMLEGWRTDPHAELQADARARRRRAVFLDLNGTLVLPIEVQTPAAYQPIPRTAEAVAALCRAGFVCPVVTVQSRIGKGAFTEREFRDWFDSLREMFAGAGASLAGPYLCPHRFAETCACKKPGGLLYCQAAADLDADIPASFVVGDTREDALGAREVGCRSVAVRTGQPLSVEVERLFDYVAADLAGAVGWILKQERTECRSTT